MDHQAFAQLLGNYGEFFASIGVLATLIYLSVQVRLARQESRAVLVQHRNDAVRELWLTLATDEKLAVAYGEGLEKVRGSKMPAHEALEELGMDFGEAVRIERYLAASFFHRQAMYQSALNKEEESALEQQIVQMYREGLGRIWFDATFPEGNKHGFSEDFVGYVREIRHRP